MKKFTFSIAFLFVACAAVLTSSCSKDDLYTTLANDASPEKATVTDTTIASGHWAVRTKLISAFQPLED